MEDNVSLMSRYVKWYLPLFLFIGIAPFTPLWDLKVSSYFYEGHFVENPVTAFLFEYGELFGFIVAGISCFCFVFFKKGRRGALVMILTLVLGAGLCINLGLKEYWGRPRPKQIEQFGGHATFLPFYKPDFKAEKQKSFPSGHAAMGWYYLALIVVGKREKSRPLLILGIVLTALLGPSLTICRLAQGGHFLSDTLASFIIMWYAALLSDFLVYSSYATRKKQDTGA